MNEQDYLQQKSDELGRPLTNEETSSLLNSLKNDNQDNPIPNNAILSKYQSLKNQSNNIVDNSPLAESLDTPKLLQNIKDAQTSPSSNILEDYYKSKNTNQPSSLDAQLQNAQDQAQSTRTGALLGESLAKIGSGLGGMAAKRSPIEIDKDYFNQLQSLANQPIEQVKQKSDLENKEAEKYFISQKGKLDAMKVAQEEVMNDPEIAKPYWSVIEKDLGLPAGSFQGSTNDALAMRWNPSSSVNKELDRQIKTTSIEINKQKIQDSQDNKEAMLHLRTAQQGISEEKRGSPLGMLRQASGRAERLDEIVQNLPKDINGNPDFSKMTRQQAEESIGIADAVMKGQSSVGGANELRKTTETYASDLNGMLQKLTGNTATLGKGGDVAKSLYNTIQQEAPVIKEQIKDQKYRGAKSHLDWLQNHGRIDDYNALMQQAQLSPEDLEARDNNHFGRDAIKYQLNKNSASPSSSSNVLPSPPDKVLVTSPDGRKGYLPKENLDKALQQGYKVVE